MQKLHGRGVYPGIAVGELQCFRHESGKVECRTVEDAEAEVRRLHSALQAEIAELDELYERALSEVGEKDAQIFQIHRMMLEDEEFIGSIEERIRSEGVNAEFAAGSAAAAAEQALSGSDDEYLTARAADIREVFGELAERLTGRRSSTPRLTRPVILAADDLSPSETVNLDKSKILAFVTAQGTSNSHTAILARGMGIPAVVATGEIPRPEWGGKTAAVDGQTGEVWIDPDAATLERYRRARDAQREDANALRGLRGLENVTRDGRKVRLYANVGGPEEVRAALENDAGGVGLFRSEFIFMGRDNLPTEEEQFEVYRAALEGMRGREVVIRTLDIGADKQLDYLRMPTEQNPAMGCRAVRLCLTQPELFKTQLRALYRASAFGKLLIMFPMIASAWEVRSCRQAAGQAREELAAQGIQHDPNVPLGIMIETPAAALISGELAKVADFFSIGTNDLTQYTLAIDRQNPALDTFYDPHHPAVLKLIETAVRSAHDHDIWAGICGELGADETLTRWFLDIGVDELSVPPSRVLPLRRAIREI